MVEVKRSKREFNKRSRGLSDEGYVKIGCFKNCHIFCKRGDKVALVQGWKRS